MTVSAKPSLLSRLKFREAGTLLELILIGAIILGTLRHGLT